MALWYCQTPGVRDIKGHPGLDVPLLPKWCVVVDCDGQNRKTYCSSRKGTEMLCQGHLGASVG